MDPLTICLNETLKRNPLSLKLFIAMIDSRKSEVIDYPENTLSDLLNKNKTTYSPLLLLYLQLMKINVLESEELMYVIDEVSQCMGLIEYIKMIPTDLRNQTLRLPQDISSKHNLSRRNVWDKFSGKVNDDLFDAVLE